MAKNTRGVKEFTREQRLIKENQALKKEISYLRKQISRLDNGRLDTLREMCIDSEEEQRFEKNIQASSNMEALKAEWSCNKDGCSGFLEINLYTKLGQSWYYRKCNECQNRTPGKRYEASVKGIIKKS